MKDKFIELKKRIKKIKNQLLALESFNLDYIIARNNEYITFGINIIFSRHEYHINKLLYHANRFIHIIENYKIPQEFPQQNDDIILTGLKDNNIFFEFDSFIYSSGAIFEEPFKNDIKKCFNENLFEDFIKIFPTKDTSESIVWRLTIIRNRIVHPDKPTYDTNGNRYIEFSSKTGNVLRLKNGFPIEIKGHLTDIKYNLEAKKILEELIKEAKEVRKRFKEYKKEKDFSFPCIPILPDFHEITFMKGKENGESKMIASKGINLIESFLSISNEIIDYLEKLHQLYYLSYKDQLGLNFALERGFYMNKELDTYIFIPGLKLENGEELELVKNLEFINQEELFN